MVVYGYVRVARLCNELRTFFPNNRVEYFVSYYDYYQPESYIPTKDIYIEKDMYYNDSTAGLHINLPKGERVLTGKEAEGYMRFRKDALGDIGRIRRQQWFFNALGARLKDPQVLVKIPEVLKVMPKYILTDLSVYELSQYAALAKGIDMSTVQVATLPGSPSQRGSISYWILDPEKTQEIINSIPAKTKKSHTNTHTHTHTH